MTCIYKYPDACVTLSVKLLWKISVGKRGDEVDAPSFIYDQQIAMIFIYSYNYVVKSEFF